MRCAVGGDESDIAALGGLDELVLQLDHNVWANRRANWISRLATSELPTNVDELMLHLQFLLSLTRPKRPNGRISSTD